MNVIHKGLVIGALALGLVGCGLSPERIKPSAEFAPVYPPEPLPAAASQGSIYQPRTGLVLFEDTKARRVGDLITVILEEETDAQKSQSTSTSRSQSINHQNPQIFGGGITANGAPVFQFSAENDQSFDVEGDTAQSNSLSGSITVAVAEVLMNGNLVVRGEKILRLSQGDEFVRLSGIVRPQDITPSNTVSSTLIANAQIAYGGSGDLDDANRQGWLSRWINKYWPL